MGLLHKLGVKEKRSRQSSTGSASIANGSQVSSTGSDDRSALTFKVTIPPGVKTGETFSVMCNGRVVRVKCPLNSKANQTIQISMPSENGGGAQPPENSPNVIKCKDDDYTYMVTIPGGVNEGQQFPCTIAGQELVITCPANARPGSQVRIVPPRPMNPQVDKNSHRGDDHKKNKVDDGMQLFEIRVPTGVVPGRPFPLIAGGARILVNCPVNARSGQTIRFRLPKELTMKVENMSDDARVRLSYDKDGWARCVNPGNFKFQWNRYDETGNIEPVLEVFDVEKSAFVRSIETYTSNDPRIKDGYLTLVKANEASSDSVVCNDRGEEVVTYGMIAEAQVKTFDEKAEWFYEACQKLKVDFNDGYMRINVRRQHLLEDSVDAVMSLSKDDFRKKWIFEFIGEPGLDAGGLTREWFELVSQQIFDPGLGLWESSAANQMCMQINPASGTYECCFGERLAMSRPRSACLKLPAPAILTLVDPLPTLCPAEFIHEDYLAYYRFIGRVMGKALFDKQLISGHMVQYLYKHLLGWPIVFKDLKALDEDIYNNLMMIPDMVKTGQDIEYILCQTFTTMQDILGERREEPLVEGGENIDLTNENYLDFMEANLKYRVMDSIKPQLNELLLGFYDVVPEPLLTIFDFQEIELLMCPLPKIKMEDWQSNTEYTGSYSEDGRQAQAVDFFWEVVESYGEQMKARLLQFVTGTSGVPSRGFAFLQGNNGNIRLFTIHGVSVEECMYPRAHTCFNRIDLPMYDNKKDLEDRLQLAVTMSATGFDIE